MTTRSFNHPSPSLPPFRIVLFNILPRVSTFSPAAIHPTADNGILTLAAFISPYRADRDAVRARLPAGRFLEIYMRVPLELCEARDPKGLYKKARAGQLKGFTGAGRTLPAINHFI